MAILYELWYDIASGRRMNKQVVARKKRIQQTAEQVRVFKIVTAFFY